MTGDRQPGGRRRARGPGSTAGAAPPVPAAAPKRPDSIALTWLSPFCVAHRHDARASDRSLTTPIAAPPDRGSPGANILADGSDGFRGGGRTTATLPQRAAVAADAREIQALMRTSVRELFPRYYDRRQTASAAAHIAHLDRQLIDDGTYLVHEAAGGEIVACGGWSRRAKLYAGAGAGEDDDRLLDPATEAARVRAMFVRGDWTRRGLGRAILEGCERAARGEGFRALTLMATLPGEPLYRAVGFRVVERLDLILPDGVAVAGVAMERAIETPGPAARGGAGLVP